jgi:hypothetical protein
MKISICFYSVFYFRRWGIPWCCAALASAVMLIAGCATAPREAPPSLRGGAADVQAGVTPALALSPWLSISGARLVAATDRTGTPSPAAGALGFTRFTRPIAIAARGGDLVILDAGAGVAYRHDAALNMMSALRGIPVHPGTQLALGADYSLYVIDQPGRRVLRVARNGQVVTTYSDAANLQRPVDVAVDDARGLVIVADGGYNQLLAFHALGGAATILHVRGAAGAGGMQAVGHLALGRDAIYVTDPLCRCVARVGYNGGVLNLFGQNDIGNPGPLAVDRYQRVFVIDQFEQVLKVFLQGKLIDTLPARRLGVQQLDDVWIDDNVLYVVDGVGARVEALRMSVPRRP